MMYTGFQIRRSFVTGACLAFLLPASFPPLQAQDADLDQMRSFAEAQHEIVVIMIRQKDYENAAREANKIFHMNWPEDQEPMLLKELLGFSEQFLHGNQQAVAVRLLEANIETFRNARHRAAIWKEKGYLLEGMGEHGKAIECFREAQRLETKAKAERSETKIKK